MPWGDEPYKHFSTFDETAQHMRASVVFRRLSERHRVDHTVNFVSVVVECEMFIISAFLYLVCDALTLYSLNTLGLFFITQRIPSPFVPPQMKQELSRLLAHVHPLPSVWRVRHVVHSSDAESVSGPSPAPELLLQGFVEPH